MTARIVAPALALALSASACGLDKSGDDPAPIADSPAAAPAAAGTPVASNFAIRADRDLTDVVRGCPGMSPDQHPRGSNCFGIFPEQCGADRASAFIGVPIDSARERILAIAPPEGVRIIRAGDPVTEDFRPGRLNVVHDDAGKITGADCS